MNQTPDWLAELKFDPNGLIPAIAQDAASGTVLMCAWMNAESLRETLRLGEAVYFSRSRQRLWHKGESSGHTQTVHEICLDCDGDVLLLKVSQHGDIACHTGRNSCFYRSLDLQAQAPQWRTTQTILKDPAQIYGAGHQSHE